MKKLATILLFCATAATLLGQAQPTRVPTSSEVNRLAGVTNNVQTELNARVFIDKPTMRVTFTAAPLTLNDTNGIIINVASSNILVTFPDATTTNAGRYYTIFNQGVAEATLTNGTQRFTSVTNSQELSFAVLSNRTATVFSTGTNWYVLRSGSNP